MNKKTEAPKEILGAVENLLKKIHRLNATIQTLEQSDTKEMLSLEGINRYKLQLTEDLVGLLKEFKLNIKIEAIAT